MNYVWFTWKDPKHPEAGGAELVNDELAKRLVADGHQVKFICGGFKDCKSTSMINGYEVIRVGNRFTLYWQAYRYYESNLADWADIVIEEINTIPFFTKLYINPSLRGAKRRGNPESSASDTGLPRFFEARNDKDTGIQPVGQTESHSDCNSKEDTKHFLFIHQLAREIWFYQMFFPLNLIGYLLEPLYLRFLNDSKVITVSNSTKQDLIDNGFKKENIHIISEGICLTPVESLCHSELQRRIPSHNTQSGDFLNNIKKESCKYENPTILSFGSVRPMKRTLDIVEAFEIAKAEIPALRLKIAGDVSGDYGERLKKYISRSKYKEDIEILGRVDDNTKTELMKRSQVLAVTSVKEGWGIVVTEAASQGTPAVVYNVDGLRDSVRHDETGLICKFNQPDYLALNIINILSDEINYERLRQNAWEWSREINFDKSYEDFIRVMKIAEIE
jgi:glycosyltransferase involved in cell wall biosynthesis